MRVVFSVGRCSTFSVSLNFFSPVHQKESDLLKVMYGGFNRIRKSSLPLVFFSIHGDC